MRGLNLSRLAQASESSFFKNEQAVQTARIWKRLSDAERAAIKLCVTESKGDTSADILMEIAAHRTYRKLARNSPVEHKVHKVGAPVSRLSGEHALSTNSTLSSFGTPRSTLGPDAQVLRALGPARLSVYEQVSRASRQTRALPGNEKYAQGATIGMMSFVIATSIVSSLGIMGGILLYRRPGIIENWRAKSIKLRERLDASVGGKLRRFREVASNKSQSILTSERIDNASALARGVARPPPSAQQDPNTERR